MEDDLMLKSAVIPELVLDYPDEAYAGEEFAISYSSTCGKMMVERAYLQGDPVYSGNNITGYEKVYTGLTCDMENLQWESLSGDEMVACTGGTLTQTWEEVGTYVYRVKVNQKAYKNSDCPDCSTFKGVMFECFMVTVVEGSKGTFTDARDGHVYDWVKIGEQVWMAENLAWLPAVSPPSTNNGPSYYVYGYSGTDVSEAKGTANYTTYGVLYTNAAAKMACPDGWHLPTDAEWKQLEMHLGMSKSEADALQSYRGTDQGAQLKSTSGWYGGGTNLSGFCGLPGGWLYGGKYQDIGSSAFWWCSDANFFRFLSSYSNGVFRYTSWIGTGNSVRCVKN